MIQFLVVVLRHNRFGYLDLDFAGLNRRKEVAKGWCMRCSRAEEIIEALTDAYNDRRMA